MDWKLYDEDGNFLQEVNCQYDSCDLANWNYNAEQIIIDFKTKTTKIIKKGDGSEE